MIIKRDVETSLFIQDLCVFCYLTPFSEVKKSVVFNTALAVFCVCVLLRGVVECVRAICRCLIV